MVRTGWGKFPLGCWDDHGVLCSLRLKTPSDKKSMLVLSDASWYSVKIAGITQKIGFGFDAIEARACHQAENSVSIPDLHYVKIRKETKDEGNNKLL